MGCDIHAYIEYRHKRPRNEWERQWRDFGGRINPGRNYAIFSTLAGVRGGPTIVQPRGVPDDIATAAHGDWWMMIYDPEQPGDRPRTDLENLMVTCLASPDDGNPKRVLFDCLGEWHAANREERMVPVGRVEFVTSEQAAAWHKYGRAYKERDGKRLWIQHPDWHTPSWLKAAEWEKAVKAAGVNPTSEPEYFGILAAMRGLEEAGYAARVVLWFDN